MEVTQVAEFVNIATKEIVGEENLVKEDLSNIVDVGTEVINGEKAIENFTRKLVDHIGRVIFVNRTYNGTAPNVLMDGWEYGSIMEKISAEMPEAKENESWQLEDGKSYDPNIFYQPKVSAKFFNSKKTLEIDQSFTEMQVKSAFSSATQMNAFMSMLHNEVNKSLTVKVDSLVERTINNMLAMTINSGGPRLVKLVTMYNQAYTGIITTPLTSDKAYHDPNFIRYASYIMGLYPKRLEKLSTLFNIGGAKRFTPKSKLHTVMLDEFVSAASTFLESDTFHKELVSLPTSDTVAFWQGSGKDYQTANTSTINVTIKSEDETNGTDIFQANILGMMFDRDALGVACVDRRVKQNYNPKAEFFSEFHKFDAMYFNDANENAVVFLAE